MQQDPGDMWARAQAFDVARDAGEFDSSTFIRPFLRALRVGLQPAGFLRRGNQLVYAPEPGLLHGIAVQRGSYRPSGPTLTYGHLTVNVVVSVEEVHRLFESNGPERQARPFGLGLGVVAHLRLGELTGDGDRWWPMAGEPAHLAEAILDLLSHTALPFLERFDTRARVRCELSEAGDLGFVVSPRLRLASMLVACDDAHGAARAVRTHLAHSTQGQGHLARVAYLVQDWNVVPAMRELGMDDELAQLGLQ